MIEKIYKTEEEWKKILTPEQFRVMRKQGTEPAFTCSSEMPKSGGEYVCAACGLSLFSSKTEFRTKIPGLEGWPSYYEPVKAENIEERPDNSLGMKRTEVLCARCESHLGHVFNEERETKTGKHYCINSVALKFQADEK